MKKYSSGYFEKKYKILLDKLLQKEGFLDAIKSSRKELKMPENGFSNEAELSYFLIQNMAKKERQTLTWSAFLDKYEYENKVRVTEETMKVPFDKFVKEHKDGTAMVPMMFQLGEIIISHHSLFTTHFLLKESKKLSKLYESVLQLMKKFWGVDLLDDSVTFHYIEKYLFLGQAGVNQYIKNKVACHNCKYLGIEHFSPDRHNMTGQDEGPYSKNYLFNERTVDMLSRYFNCVFMIIKPYATKEMAIQYIEDNWDDLKEHIIMKNTFYKQYDVNPSLIKESDDEKNRLVYELNKLSKKELLKIYNGQKDFNHSGVYKEAIVSAILQEEYGIEMTSDAVKKCASRYSQSIKIQKVPKDIEDLRKIRDI